MTKMLFIIIVSVITVSVLTVFIGKAVLNGKFRSQANLLLSRSKTVSESRFQYDQIIGLPSPVQKYFKHVLKEGQPYISYVRLEHDGQFKTALDKDWINIKGEHYATMDTPGFIWKGTTAMFTARDMYIGDRGRLVVSLFSLLNIVDAKGEKYDKGELLRWLGESILYPTNLLPNPRLQWTAIDSLRAKLSFSYKDLSLFFIVTFNEIGEITQMETQRFMGESNLETWIINASNYNEMNDVIIPCSFEVLWRLKKGDFSYARFHIKTVTYNEHVKVN